MTWSLGDTDLFVCLLHHITVSWKDVGLQEFWLIRNSGLRRLILPLHYICTALGKVHTVFPALHALIGCDTTNNISTKLAALNENYRQDFISDPQLKQFRADRKHDADGRNIPGEVCQANNRPGTFDIVCLTMFNGNALKTDFKRTLSPQSTQENTKSTFLIRGVDTSPI